MLIRVSLVRSQPSEPTHNGNEAVTIHWHVGRETLDIYDDGKLVAQIPAASYLVLIQALAAKLTEKGKNP